MQLARSESVEIPSCQNHGSVGQNARRGLPEPRAQRPRGSDKASSVVESSPSQLPSLGLCLQEMLNTLWRLESDSFRSHLVSLAGEWDARSQRVGAE